MKYFGFFYAYLLILLVFFNALRRIAFDGDLTVTDNVISFELIPASITFKKQFVKKLSLIQFWKK